MSTMRKPEHILLASNIVCMCFLMQSRILVHEEQAKQVIYKSKYLLVNPWLQMTLGKLSLILNFSNFYQPYRILARPAIKQVWTLI